MTINRMKSDTGPEHVAPNNLDYLSSFDEYAGLTETDKTRFLAERGAGFRNFVRAFEFGRSQARSSGTRTWAQAQNDVRAEWDKQSGEWGDNRAAIAQGWESVKGTG